MQKKKKVLIISYYFPPENQIAALRLGKFAKYLPEYGWEPVVVTADTQYTKPQVLPLEIDCELVSRVSYFSFSNFVIKRCLKTSHNKSDSSRDLVGLGQVNKKTWISKLLGVLKPLYSNPLLSKLLHNSSYWYYPALKKCFDIINSREIDVIFSSYGPSVNHLIASKLQKRTRIPWVADYRDLWSLNPYHQKPALIHAIEKRREITTIINAKRLITISRPMAEDLTQLHCKPVSIIPNGFDAEDYKERAPLLDSFILPNLIPRP